MPATKMNNLSGKEWLQNSFTIWRDIRKSKEETKLKHPAMFPQYLVEKLIDIYTKDPGEVILDPFMGSGSTTLAAMNKGKKGIGIELSEEYIQIAKKRVNTYQVDLLNSGKIIHPDIIHDGEIQFDVAVDKTVSIKKTNNSLLNASAVNSFN